MTEIERLRAELAAANAREAGLRAALNEALIKQENDRTLWNEEWQVWAVDARAALAQPSTEGVK